MSEPSWLEWQEQGETRRARWRSENGSPPPKRVQVADDTLSADAAYRLACEGTALLWRGDYHNARQLLQAMARRTERKALKPASTLTETFHLQRQAQAQRARVLGMLLVPLEAGFVIPLRRAPLVAEACQQACGEAGDEPCVMSLRELQGMIGAFEWRKNGVEIPALAQGHDYDQPIANVHKA